LLCAALILSSGCTSVSTKPALEPTPPRVDCKKDATAPLAAAPDVWVECNARGCRLSEVGAKYIVGLFGAVTEERTLRAAEHACLDAHEKEGVITQ
jgi:hypothetical protein